MVKSAKQSNCAFECIAGNECKYQIRLKIEMKLLIHEILCRRLDVAKTHKRQADIDWVLQQRQKYLKAINREEYLPAFKQLNNQTN